MPSRHKLFAAATFASTIALVLLFLDIVLVLRPTVFGEYLGNAIFSRYGTKPGDMYYFVPAISNYFMWPDFHTRAYYNGYFWDHRTDARGFRNPSGRESDIVLQGDSLVYGHGVEVDQGVSEILARDYGWHTYNLSQQGDCLYQTVLKAHLYLDELKPRVFLHFAFLNDPLDLEIYRMTDEIEAAPELDREDWTPLRERVDALGRVGGTHPMFSQIPAVRFFGALWGELAERWRRLFITIGPGTLTEPLLDEERRERIQDYYDRAIARLAERTERAGTRFAVVNLDVSPESGPEARARFRDLLASATEKSGVPFFDTGDRLIDCADCALPADGHLSPKGHAVLAAQVDEWLHALLESDPPAH